MFFRFDMIHERDRRTDRQTDGRTDRRTPHRPRLCIASRGNQQRRRMHVVYDKIAIDTARRSPENNTATAYRSVVELRDKQESSDPWPATRWWMSRLPQMTMMQKYSKMQHTYDIFAYNGLP